jgi:2-polyprenyl-6-methoxyphenol hydroxylase-like FAD-dependent oxidoreductase
MLYIQVGAGVQIPPNSSLLLERWGVSPFLTSAAVEPHEWIVRRWQNGKLIGRTQLVPYYYECFGAPYYVLHRAHYHHALYERAKELGVDVRVNSKATKYDLEAPSVELSDGTLIFADLVVAADGVHSTARRLILGKDYDPKPSGFAAYRATVDTKKIRAHPELSWVLDKSNQNIW